MQKNGKILYHEIKLHLNPFILFVRNRIENEKKPKYLKFIIRETDFIHSLQHPTDEIEFYKFIYAYKI